FFLTDSVAGKIYKFTHDGARSTFATGLNQPTFMAFAPNTVLPDATPPTVTVVASDANASEAALDSGTFTISRAGDTNSDLTVFFTLGGSATSGSDYQPIGDSVTIPTGAVSSDIVVEPLEETDVAWSEIVDLN